MNETFITNLTNLVIEVINTKTINVADETFVRFKKAKIQKQAEKDYEMSDDSFVLLLLDRNEASN